MIFRLLFLSGIGHRTLVLLFIESLKYRPQCGHSIVKGAQRGNTDGSSRAWRNCSDGPRETCCHVDGSPRFMVLFSIALVMYSELRLEKPKFVLALGRETPNSFYFIIHVFHFIVGYQFILFSLSNYLWYASTGKTTHRGFGIIHGLRRSWGEVTQLPTEERKDHCT